MKWGRKERKVKGGSQARGLVGWVAEVMGVDRASGLSLKYQNHLHPTRRQKE
jgi:hypothetical protein